MIGIVNYGSGNFTSVFNAINSITERIKIIGSDVDFQNCSHIILPGVGAYKKAMEQMNSLRLIDELKEQVIIKKKPFLGICVGMQILSNYGFEFEKCEGLGLIDADVVKFDTERIGTRHLPHMGWNDVINYVGDPLFKNIKSEDPSFYFVHSYHMSLNKSKDISWTLAEYGYLFPAAVRKDNIFGVQFHPEKSQTNGIQLLRNFISL